MEMAYDMEGSGSFSVLGTVNDVPSGDNADITWLNLDPGTQYEWYVEVSDGIATTTSSTWDFTTATTTYDLTMAVDPSGGGTTDPSEGIHTYAEGAEVTISGTAAAGYTFDHWTGDIIGSENPTTFTMNADKSVTAVFTQDICTLTVNVIGDGSVTLDPAGGSYTYGTLVQLTADADTGWIFSGWSDDLSGSTNPETITMDGNKTVTATFTAETDIIGDVNGDGIVNSTDALIVLSCDVGIDTSAYCPMNRGDVNGDGLVNSTDALIILSYDVGISVPYPVGEPGYPSDVTPCPGCGP
jgi:uncharacterized repeat protein (TIGR02543 family)